MEGLTEKAEKNIIVDLLGRRFSIAVLCFELRYYKVSKLQCDVILNGVFKRLGSSRSIATLIFKEGFPKHTSNPEQL